MPSSLTRRAFAVGIAASIAPLRGYAASPRTPDPPVKISITARPIATFYPRSPSQTRFGALEFRGGLELSSDYKPFGGLSALRVDADGQRFLSLSDHGTWLRGRIVYDQDRPAAIADAEMAPILGTDYRPLAAHGWFDTESIAIDGGTVYVGIERVNRIVKFDYGRFGLLAPGQPIATPPGIATLPNNKGLEALVFVPSGRPLGGALIAVSERGLDANGNLKSFLIGGPRPGDFAVKRSDDYDVSDCALLFSDDLLLLERKFSWTTGLRIRIRKIALASVQPGAVVDGPVLIDVGMSHEIDNMEGLSVHRSTRGEVVLTLISDDNFSVLQRTVLLQFVMPTP